MTTIRDFALGLISRTPSIANNPNAQQMLNVIRENNAEQGSRIAKNLCDSYGLTTEQAIGEAKRFFGIP